MSNNILINDKRLYEGYDKAFDDLRKSMTLVAVIAGPNAVAADVSLNAAIATACAAYDADVASVYIHDLISLVRVTVAGAVTFAVEGTGNNQVSLSGGVLTQEVGTNWTTSPYKFIVIFRGDLS